MCNYGVARLGKEFVLERHVTEREVTLPASREDVWAALTDPARVRTWFGADVEWDLRPGGPARFSSTEGDGVKAGVVEVVIPAETLRYRWWPIEDAAEPASEVTYTLEDAPDGTRLTVTEEPLGPEVSAARLRAQASATSAVGLAVSPWDFRVVALFVCVAARVLVCA